MPSASFERLQRFVQNLQKHTPGINIKYKTESLLMKLFGFLLFFNPKFMTGFVTTVGSTVYFPDRKELEERTSSGAIVTMSHEFQHIKDHNKYGALPYVFAYMFPQILAPFMLLFAFIYWPLAIALAALCLAPLPAPGRKHFELKGYIMSLFTTNEFLKEYNVSEVDRRVKLTESAAKKNANFTGFGYYLMWPFGVEKELTLAVDKIISGEILKDDVIYSEIVAALSESKSL